MRVVADSSPDRAWLRWATPLGWLELAHPLTEPRILPIVLSYVLAVVLGGLAVLLVRARDTGAGLLADSGGRRSRTRGLDGATGLALRLARGTAWSWGIGLALFGGLIGLVARTASQAMADSDTGDVLGGLGVDDTGTTAYVGVLFVILTVALAAAAAGRVAAIREEEATGRVENILVRPVTRPQWLLGRLGVAVGILVLGASATSLGAWAAGQAGDLGVGFADLAKAGANCVPAAVFVLGAGTLVYGFWPRQAATLSYSYVAAAFLVEFVGSAVELPSWVLNLSVLHHVAPVPAVEADLTSAAAMVLLGLVLGALGVVGFARRDVVPA
jgi:ABC-2 type transport system permease protein